MPQAPVPVTLIVFRLQAKPGEGLGATPSSHQPAPKRTTALGALQGLLEHIARSRLPLVSKKEVLEGKYSIFRTLRKTSPGAEGRGQIRC